MKKYMIDVCGNYMYITACDGSETHCYEVHNRDEFVEALKEMVK